MISARRLSSFSFLSAAVSVNSPFSIMMRAAADSNSVPNVAKSSAPLACSPLEKFLKTASEARTLSIPSLPVVR